MKEEIALLKEIYEIDLDKHFQKNITKLGL